MSDPYAGGGDRGRVERRNGQAVRCLGAEGAKLVADTPSCGVLPPGDKAGKDARSSKEEESTLLAFWHGSAPTTPKPSLLPAPSPRLTSPVGGQQRVGAHLGDRERGVCIWVRLALGAAHVRREDTADRTVLEVKGFGQKEAERAGRPCRH